MAIILRIPGPEIKEDASKLKVVDSISGYLGCDTSTVF
jgi:hypothetical protein